MSLHPNKGMDIFVNALFLPFVALFVHPMIPMHHHLMTSHFLRLSCLLSHRVFYFVGLFGTHTLLEEGCINFINNQKESQVPASKNPLFVFLDRDFSMIPRSNGVHPVVNDTRGGGRSRFLRYVPFYGLV